MCTHFFRKFAKPWVNGNIFPFFPFFLVHTTSLAGSCMTMCARILPINCPRIASEGLREEVLHAHTSFF